MDNKEFLGRGWSFPPKFDKYSKSVVMDNGEEDIANSIRIIIGTYPGERLMNPVFGCTIKRMNFENIDQGNITRIEEIIGNSLIKFEPRIKLQSIEIVSQDETEGLIILQLNYTIISTNTRHNIVFPYYLTEGTNL
jgi:phage baseplate assembly protein W